MDLIFDVTKIDNLNSSYILENKPKFSIEKFIYFNPIINSNFLLIGVEDIRISEINNFGLQNIFKIGIFEFDMLENKNIITFKFGNLTINNEYIINSYIQNISYYNEIIGFHSTNNKYDYNIFINKSNFTLNHKLEKENNENNIEKLKKDETDRIYVLRKKEKEIIKSSKSNDCFIATMVYKDNNHRIIQLLRNYRDTKLHKKSWGKLFIHYYYKYSPLIVKKLHNNKLAIYTFKFLIEKVFIKLIN